MEYHKKFLGERVLIKGHRENERLTGIIVGGYSHNNYVICVDNYKKDFRYRNFLLEGGWDWCSRDLFDLNNCIVEYKGFCEIIEKETNKSLIYEIF